MCLQQVCLIKGDLANPCNFRPISILPVPRKLLKKLVHLQLSSLNSSNLLFTLQSSFCSSHSIQTLLLCCLDLCYKALDQRSSVGVIFLDSTEIFDTATHVSKLSSLRVSASAVSWFQSYLSNYCHITRVADSYSSPVLLFLWCSPRLCTWYHPLCIHP